jgi:hypothetical protein
MKPPMTVDQKFQKPEATVPGYSGNIDLAKRPVVHNSDGSISTVKSSSFNIDGKEVLLPTISPEGKVLSNQEAVQLYRRTGQHLGRFNTIQEADIAAQRIHLQQEKFYRGR